MKGNEKHRGYYLSTSSWITFTTPIRIQFSQDTLLGFISIRTPFVSIEVTGCTSSTSA
jgi:hypothetical protein